MYWFLGYYGWMTSINLWLQLLSTIVIFWMWASLKECSYWSLNPGAKPEPTVHLAIALSGVVLKLMHPPSPPWPWCGSVEYRELMNTCHSACAEHWTAVNILSCKSSQGKLCEPPTFFLYWFPNRLLKQVFTFSWSATIVIEYCTLLREYKSKWYRTFVLQLVIVLLRMGEGNIPFYCQLIQKCLVAMFCTTTHE